MPNTKKILENVRLAAGCGAAPTMLLTVALASMGAASVGEAIDRLNRLRPDVERLERETPKPHQQLAELEPELVSEPPVARMRLEIGDHELRGRLVFGELLGNKSFIQVAALAIAGLELSDSDARLLDHVGVLAQLADPTIWPLTVTRRVAANGGSLAESVVAGLATLCTEQMTALPAAGFMRYLDRVATMTAAGASVVQAVAETVGGGERVPGIGRPVLGNDERVAPMLDLARRHGRGEGASVVMATQIDAAVAKLKGLRVNSAGYCGALQRDLGFEPDAAAAFCLIYFIVPLLTHAASVGRGLPAAASPPASPRQLGDCQEGDRHSVVE